MTHIRQSLYLQVLIAIVLGVLVGHFAPNSADLLKPLGDGFIKLVKMLIAPVIFCTVVIGIAGMANMKKVGKTGGLALLYFEVVSTLALVVGLIVVNWVKPGVGLHINAAALNTDAIAAYTAPGKLQTTTDFLLNIIPITVVDAFAKGEILQILLLALLTGFALHALGGRNHRVFSLVQDINALTFKVIGYVMALAPIGAFGAMAYTVGHYGLASLVPLAKLMACFYATCVLFIFLVLGSIARAHGFSVWRLIRYLKAELLIVLGTSSSETALPGLMAKLEKLGAQPSVVGLVVPTGYSFNLDGTAIYLTMAAVFVAQATDTPLTLVQELGLLGVLLLTSKGAAGVTGSGFIVLAATLSSLGTVPVAGLALILGIDRFMSEARALTNLIGNAVATLVVAKWTDSLDQATLQAEGVG